MKRLKSIKENLVNIVCGQLSHLDSTDTKELGEAIDMIKDMEEAIYYCTIVKAMEEKDKEPSYQRGEDSYRYYGTFMRDREDWRDMPAERGDMPDMRRRPREDKDWDMRSPEERPRDMREGRSPESRRTYMESKELHKDKTTKMHELEKYMQELSHDIIEMIEDASPEEKQLLQSKIAELAKKITI